MARCFHFLRYHPWSIIPFALCEVGIKAISVGVVLFVLGEPEWWAVGLYVTAFLWQVPEGTS